MDTDVRSELTARILAELQAGRDASPAVIYELRGDEDDIIRRLTFDGHRAGTEGQDQWELACRTADILSGQLCTTLTIWQVRIFTSLAGRETRREDSYIVDSSGGSQYWNDRTDDRGSHQVSSAGFCWTCLLPDRDLDQERHGLIRHPVTPDEIGHAAYRCFVCGVEGSDPDSGHADVDHTVTWGEETHPRCTECGDSRQIATPEGIGYVQHGVTCSHHISRED